MRGLIVGNRGVQLTDSLSLFNEVIRTPIVTKEKIIMKYIAAVQEAYENREISEVGSIPSSNNMAEAFLKVGGCPPLDLGF